MYRVDTYFLAKQAAELPFQILMPTIFISLQYFMIGFRASTEAFIMFVFITSLVANCGISFGKLRLWQTMTSFSFLSLFAHHRIYDIMPFFIDKDGDRSLLSFDIASATFWRLFYQQ